MKFHISGMSCSSCAQKIESTLVKLPGVNEVNLNFATKIVEVEGDFDASKAISSTKALGYQLTILEDNKISIGVERKEREKEYKSLKVKLLISIFLTLPIFLIAMKLLPSSVSISPPWDGWIQFVLVIPIIAYCGKIFITSMVQFFKTAHANMNTLIGLGVTSSFIYSVLVLLFPIYFSVGGLKHQYYFESIGFIITFVLLGQLLENRARDKTAFSIEKLLSLRPDEVIALRNDKEVKLSLSEVLIDDILLVRTGDKVPIDGEIIEGAGLLDESMLTGESIPVQKKVGEKVVGGTINQNGFFKLKVKTIGSDTVLSQIIQMVEHAQLTKAPIQKIADKVSSVFVPVVLVVAVSSFLLWMVFGPNPKYIFAFISMVSVLLIACPCALGLATPTAIMVGSGRAAENGVLFKTSGSIESCDKITALVLDKTGTITMGRPNVVSIEEDLEGVDSKYLNNLLFSIEAKVSHPLAKALILYAQQNDATNIELKNFENIEGHGVKAFFNEDVIIVGNELLMKNNNCSVSDKIQKSVLNWKQKGFSLVYQAINQKVKRVYAISDPIKPEAEKFISNLDKLGIIVWMATGDHTLAAKEVARRTGIVNVLSQATPHDKLEKVKELQELGHVVAMVGDGINDSPALAKADVGISIGTGSDVAIESSDVTLLTGSLTSLFLAIQLSKKTISTVKVNLILSFSYNIIGIPLAAGLLYPMTGQLLPPMFAAFAMAMSSVSVVLNSLRLRVVQINA